MANQTETHRIIIKSSSPLGDVWSLEAPEGYTVDHEEPLKKGLDFLTTIPQPTVWEIIVILHLIGFTDWVKNKSFDALWEYLKSAIITAKKPVNASMRIGNQTGQEIVIGPHAWKENDIKELKIKVTKEALSLKVEFNDSSKRK